MDYKTSLAGRNLELFKKKKKWRAVKNLNDMQRQSQKLIFPPSPTPVPPPPPSPDNGIRVLTANFKGISQSSFTAAWTAICPSSRTWRTQEYFWPENITGVLLRTNQTHPKKIKSLLPNTWRIHFNIKYQFCRIGHHHLPPVCVIAVHTPHRIVHRAVRGRSSGNI